MENIQLKKLRKSGCALLVAGIAGLWSLNASAIPSSCATTSSMLSKVTGLTTEATAVSDCQYLEPPSDAGTVADAEHVKGFFGIEDWESIFNTEDPKQTPKNGQSGEWNLGEDYNFSLYDYMITFKDGAKKTNLISFLFNEEYSKGLWTTPFTSEVFPLVENTSDVSHYNIFRTESTGTGGPGPDVPVPEPGTLALLGLGLVGLTLARRKAKVA